MIDLFNYYEEDAKLERCGLILKGDKILECKNIHLEPSKGFEIDPEDIIKHLDDMVATWHTHPNQASTLSGEDHLCFTTWPDLKHFIIGSDGISVYIIREGAVICDSKIPW